MKTNNIQELFNNTINNTEKNNNSPDECYVMGTKYDTFFSIYIKNDKWDCVF